MCKRILQFKNNWLANLATYVLSHAILNYGDKPIRPVKDAQGGISVVAKTLEFLNSHKYAFLSCLSTRIIAKDAKSLKATARAGLSYPGL